MTTELSITAICFALGLGLKNISPLPNKWIPPILALCGGVLGGLFMVNDEPLVEIALGIMAGLSAVGIKEIGNVFKQEVQ